MKKKRFYGHLVETDSVVVKLHELQMSEEEKAQLVDLMESHLDHVILDAILSELSEEDKILFMQELASDNDDSIWEFLKKRIDHIEDKIATAAEALKKELHEDIKEVKDNG
jgi:hypothetical protein